MISYGKQTIDQSDIDAVVEILKGDWLTQGPTIEKFEVDLQNYFGAKYTCAVSNGTAALHLTALALGWQLGDIVITTPTTFLATVNCIVYAGATPDFVDINLDTYTIDPNLVEEKIKIYHSKGKEIKAVIGVDYAGHPSDWKALRELADKYNFQLVNDNCHALGATYFDNKKYAVNYADVVIQSYHPVKHITSGEGGAILTDDPRIDEKVRRLRNHGMIKDPKELSKHDGPWYYEINEVGYNYRITDFQCALGSNQVIRLDDFVKKRRKIAKIYDELFCDIDNFEIPKTNKAVNHAYHLYALQIDFDKLLLNKRVLFKKMKQVDINLQVHYYPVHIQPYYKKQYGFKKGDFPNSEKFYEQEISLPIYPNLSEEDQNFVIDRITQYYTS